MIARLEPKSSLRELVSFLATVKGDLSNITCPPNILAPQSFVEFPCYWAEYPSAFVAPASEPDPEKRALKVLTWFLTCLRRQHYVGRDPSEAVKKPLNAFLGEIFKGQFDDGHARVQVVSEQVSHHPPITACRVWSEQYGVWAEGYSRQSMTFASGVSIKQVGHAIIHIDRYDEDYLIPLLDVKVKGFLSGVPYPEIIGTYRILSSSGYVSEITFSGQGFFSGTKNSFQASLFRAGTTGNSAVASKPSPLYSVSGQWSHKFTVHRCPSGADTEVVVQTYDMDKIEATPISLAELDDQDPWESRRAWRHVIEAIEEGDLQRVAVEKSKLEEAQRALRRRESARGHVWESAFFSSSADDDSTKTTTTTMSAKLASLLAANDIRLNADKTKGLWTFDAARAEKTNADAQANKGLRGSLTPFG